MAKDLKLEKFTCLLKSMGLVLDDEKSEKIMDAILDNKVGLKEFQSTANKVAGIALQPDPLAEKYKDYLLTSRQQFISLCEEKLEGNLTVYIDDVNVHTLQQYMKDEGFGEAEGCLHQNNTKEDMLEMTLELGPDDYRTIWPTEEYRDKEMDEWCEEICDENNLIWEWNAPESIWTNYVRKHHDLTGGKIALSEDDMSKVDKIKVEGRPLHEAVTALRLNPELDTEGLKSLLRNGQRLEKMLTHFNRVSHASVFQRDGSSYVRCSIDGVPQMGTRLSNSNALAYREGRVDAAVLAYRSFATELIETAQERSKGLGR